MRTWMVLVGVALRLLMGPLWAYAAPHSQAWRAVAIGAHIYGSMAIAHGTHVHRYGTTKSVAHLLRVGVVAACAAVAYSWAWCTFGR